MSRLGHYLVPGLLLSPVILLCGKLLFTSVPDAKQTARFRAPVAERGWPWVYSHSLDLGTAARSLKFSAPMLAADIAVLLVVIATAAALLIWHRRRHRSWFRFSLRDMLALTTLVGAGVGWWTYQEHRWQQERELVKRLGDTIQVMERRYFEPQWLRRLWPHDELSRFYSVTWVRAKRDPIRVDDDTVKALSTLSHLRVAELIDCPISDVALSYLARCGHLEQIDLSGTDVTDIGVAHLGKLHRLTRLNLSCTVITDAAIDTIVQLTALDDVDISFCDSVTDRGVQRLLELPKLIRALVPEMPQISWETHRSIKKALIDRLVADSWDRR